MARELRLSTLVRVVVVVVVVSPVLLVWGLERLNRRFEEGMRDNVAAAISEMEAAGDRMPEVAEQVASHRRLRVWLLDPSGDDLLQIDRERRGSRLGPASLVTAPRMGVDAHDERLPPPQDRSEVRHAFEHGSYSQCSLEMDGHLQQCSHAKRVRFRGADAVVYVRDSASLGVQRLPTVQEPLWVLTGVVMLLGLGLSTWLVRRIARPLEALRAAVLARRGREDLAPIAVQGPSEVADVTKAMNALHEALAERSRRNQAFVDDVAHEVKGPLATMGTCAELLESGKELTPERAARLAKMLRESSVRLNRNVMDWLSLARAEAGLPGEERTLLDVSVLVERIVAADDAVVFDGCRGAMVQGVERELEVAIRNLVDNAIHYTPEGGEVRVSVEKHAGRIVIDVRDDGPGIAPEDREKVFERFYSKRSGGSGLGLTSARAIVRAHGGSLTALESARGAWLRVTLG